MLTVKCLAKARPKGQKQTPRRICIVFKVPGKCSTTLYCCAPKVALQTLTVKTNKQCSSLCSLVHDCDSCANELPSGQDLGDLRSTERYLLSLPTTLSSQTTPVPSREIRTIFLPEAERERQLEQRCSSSHKNEPLDTPYTIAFGSQAAPRSQYDNYSHSCC